MKNDAKKISQQTWYYTCFKKLMQITWKMQQNCTSRPQIAILCRRELIQNKHMHGKISSKQAPCNCASMLRYSNKSLLRYEIFLWRTARETTNSHWMFCKFTYFGTYAYNKFISNEKSRPKNSENWVSYTIQQEIEIWKNSVW